MDGNDENDNLNIALYNIDIDVCHNCNCLLSLLYTLNAVFHGIYNGPVYKRNDATSASVNFALIAIGSFIKLCNILP